MVVGLSALLAIYAKLFRSASERSAVVGDRPTMTAMIPALNEEETIPYALTSLAMQTVLPDRVIVVDDGSTDDTPRIVRELDDELEMTVELRQHAEPMGKTVGMKEVARSVGTDTLFVLDADTFLESNDYLAKLLAPHTESNVASSFGTAYPIETASKRELYERHAAGLLPDGGITMSHMETDLEAAESRSGPLDYLRSNAPIVQFRNIDYHVQQRIFADGLMRLFDSTLFPVGCGVLYDRRRLVSVFDAYEESHGDDLTNSEDIFIGFAFCDRGLRNVRLGDTYMRSEVPKLRRTYRQNYLWGSGYLQSAYYFGELSRRFRSQRVATDGGLPPTSEGRQRIKGPPRRQDETDRRTISDESAPPSSDGADAAVKRPMGWPVVAQLVDGLYPTAALVFVLLSFVGIMAIELVVLFVIWEFTLFALLALATRTKRLALLRNVVPFVVIRFLLLPVLTYTYLRVGTDIVTGNRDWRK